MARQPTPPFEGGGKGGGDLSKIAVYNSGLLNIIRLIQSYSDAILSDASPVSWDISWVDIPIDFIFTAMSMAIFI